jgi:ribosomal-protein-alanine N-acetyltransferase
MYIRLMRKQDVAQVSQIDREAFPTDWPPTNFGRELENRLAYYIVACENPPPPTSKHPAPSALQKSPGLLERLKHFFGGNEEVTMELEESIIGYAGMWILADEAHIMSIASCPEYRHKGVGEALLFALFDLAQRHKARVVTLEVRVSNTVARNLYLKYGFKQAGIRKGYYLDNKEDAFIMTTEYIGSRDFQEQLCGLKKAHVQRWGDTCYQLEKLDVKLG